MRNERTRWTALIEEKVKEKRKNEICHALDRRGFCKGLLGNDKESTTSS